MLNRLNRHDLSDEEWERLRVFLPADPPRGERCFSELEQFRAVATRYDKRERTYQGTIDVASISIWLRDPVHDPRDTP